MERLIVRNCGPIKEATVDVRKNTVFIGPQGSGKSTLAKLVALCTDTTVLPIDRGAVDLLVNYNLESYVNSDTYFRFETSLYYVEYKGRLIFNLTEKGLALNKDAINQLRNTNPAYSKDLPLDFPDYVLAYDKNKNSTPPFSNPGKSFSVSFGHYYPFLKKYILKNPCTYIPSERNLTALLSSAIWSLMYSDINIPKPLALFGRNFEEARNQINALSIPFLDIRYSYENGKDRIYYGDQGSVDLGKSASGYQSIIPLLLVVDYLRNKESRRFILEEPELNLFPQAQKELIYYLLKQEENNLHQTQTVITTHSPYVLSAINNLLFASIVAESIPENRAEIEQVIPSQSWLNPSDFSAYFVENGTIRSILNESTGLIADNELDDVSENIAGERDQLLTIYRNGQRERTN